VVAGFLAVALLSIGTDIVMHAIGVFPPWNRPMSNGLFALATAYRTIYTVLGGYITAQLAPDRPVQHAIVLGVFGLIAASAGAAATWNRGPAFGPHWYPLAIAVLAIPCTWAGGRLSTMLNATRDPESQVSR
jgi:hypothetical protein